MADIFLTQEEADTLFGMAKYPGSEDAFDFPSLGGRIKVPLISYDSRESFILDVNRKRISLCLTTQIRARTNCVLARLDFGAPHQNPDGSVVGSPHLHLYKEGYGDKWAYMVPDGMLSDGDNAWQVLLDFCKFCHIVRIPNISRGLF